MNTIKSAGIALSVCLVVCIGILFGLNWVAEQYLRANPEILLTRAERINENTRAIRETMIPKNKIPEWYALESSTDLAAMWEEFYNAGAEFESYVHYRSRALEGKYYGTTKAGYRKVRNQASWPIDKNKYNIFFFGGSTSFGVGPYWATIASYLQDELTKTRADDRDVAVYNFGRSGYFSAQEIILFQRLLTNGHVPNMVVFLDGLNDFCWIDGQPSSWTMLARHFNSVNDESRNRSANHGIVTEWNKVASFLETLPLSRLLNAFLSRAVEEPLPQYTKPENAVQEPPPDAAILESVINRYLSFKKQAEGVASSFGIAPVFVWQPIPTYKYDATHHLFFPDRLGCHIHSKYGYPVMADKVKKMGGLGSNFIWLADMQEPSKEPLYVDAFHYTAPMSRRIAERIADQISARGLMDQKITPAR